MKNPWPMKALIAASLALMPLDANVCPEPTPAVPAEYVEPSFNRHQRRAFAAITRSKRKPGRKRK